MKDTRYIIGLDEKALEALAKDRSVEVPQDLCDRVNDALVAAALPHDRSSGPLSILKIHPYAVSATLSFACAAAIFATLHFRSSAQPVDTFDDPHLAYAAFDKAFGRISGKVNECARISSAAEHAIELTSETINRIKFNE